ncbi:MAG: proton-conducting transporter membrane subunit [Planctomycetota bacterium]
MLAAAALWLLLAIPLAGVPWCATVRRQRAALAAAGLIVGLAAAAAGIAIAAVVRGETVTAARGWFFLDMLSAYHLGIMMLIFGMCTAYAWAYFGAELRLGRLTLGQARQFAALWSGALFAMTLVLISNNVGIMWVGVEATTLVTAFLICIHINRVSLEAMWKYILICSVGVAFAFMGVLLVAAALPAGIPDPVRGLAWTDLVANAHTLDPLKIKAAFLFLLVGYGTKAGLAPMHNWLPDAHSQAPAPVSALFSGFMLNAALYCLMRFLPITEAATGNAGWAMGIFRLFGIISILTAAVFIMFQKDLKRLLAYSSVEHMGIIIFGLGLGPLGAAAALFHTLNHAVCKSLAFFAAGRLGQQFGSHEISVLEGALRRSPVWGAGIFGSLLALVGVAPFALFMSEFQILKAALDFKLVTAVVLFLVGNAIVFVGATAHAIDLAWGGGEDAAPDTTTRRFEIVLVVLPLAGLLLLGLWMPGPLHRMLTAAAAIMAPGAGVTP